MTDLLTTAQAAARLGITPATVRQVVARGALPVAQWLDGRTPLYRPADVDAYAARRKPAPSRPGR